MGLKQKDNSSLRITGKRPARDQKVMVTKILSLVFGLLGLSCWLVAGGFSVYGAFLNPNTATTEGTVLSLVKRNSKNSQAPMVEYTVAGINYQRTGNVFSSSSSFKPGD